MELINATRMAAGYSMGLEPDGRELLVVVVKGSFAIPASGQAVRLADQQLALALADAFSGAPGWSAPVAEADFAPRKAVCDVLLTGCARAPQGRPVARLRVGLRVGSMNKRFDVVGDRFWQPVRGRIGVSEPEAFTQKLVSYDTAFGGGEAEGGFYAANPAGRGWRRPGPPEALDGVALPNTEAPGRPVVTPHADLVPMALGPLARGWPARARFAGTYDEAWLADVFPFLPKDFDPRYHQAAPEDQQLPASNEPLEVVLEGFHADGARHFTLPHFEAPVSVFPRRGEREDHVATLDTIAFDPDHDRFTMSWRLARPLKRGMLEIAQVLVGRKGPAWWQQRERVAFPIPVVMVPMEPDLSLP